MLPIIYLNYLVKNKSFQQHAIVIRTGNTITYANNVLLMHTVTGKTIL
jgi:D-ribose pyranose/furanose isomerase RbsD